MLESIGDSGSTFNATLKYDFEISQCPLVH